MEVSKNSTELLGARKIGLLWAERVRKKKKNLAKKEEVDLMTEKRRDSFEVPICFSEGRRVSGLEIVAWHLKIPLREFSTCMTQSQMLQKYRCNLPAKF